MQLGFRVPSFLNTHLKNSNDIRPGNKTSTPRAVQYEELLNLLACHLYWCRFAKSFPLLCCAGVSGLRAGSCAARPCRSDCERHTRCGQDRVMHTRAAHEPFPCVSSSRYACARLVHGA